MVQCLNVLGRRGALTHHQPLDVPNPHMLHRASKEDDTERSPGQNHDPEGHRDEPVERRQVIRSVEDDVQRGGIDDEHSEGRSGKDTQEVPFVRHNPLTEWEAQAGLDSEDL